MIGADQHRCIVCRQVRTIHQTLTLTEQEKAAIRLAGVEPYDEVHYCGPCLTLLRDRERGAQLLRGRMHIEMRSQGRTDSAARSMKFYDMLIKRGKLTS